MSKQSTRRRLARERQQQHDQADDQPTPFRRGFAAVLHEPGRGPRVLAQREATGPPSEEERARAIGAIATATDPGGEQTHDDLDALLDDVRDLDDDPVSSTATDDDDTDDDNDGLPLIVDDPECGPIEEVGWPGE